MGTGNDNNIDLKYANIFRNEYYGENNPQAPLIRTIKRVIERNNITRKKFELRHFKTIIE